MDQQLTGFKCGKCGIAHQAGVAMCRLSDMYVCGECLHVYHQNVKKQTEHLWVKE